MVFIRPMVEERLLKWKNSEILGVMLRFVDRFHRASLLLMLWGTQDDILMWFDEWSQRNREVT